MRSAATVLVVMVGCHASPPPAPKGLDAPATHELMGSAPDFAFSARVDLLRSDAVYGPILRDLFSEKDLATLYDNVSAVDGVGAFDGATMKQTSFVGVLRATSALAPLPKSWRDAIEEKDAAKKLPSGVLEITSIDKSGWPYGIYATPADWVLLTGRAAGPGHTWVSAHETSPPPVDFGDGVLLGFWMGGAAMHRAAMADTAKQPGSEGLESLTIVLRSGAYGDLIYRAGYDTREHARVAASALSDSVGMYASVWANARERCPALGELQLTAKQDDTRVEAVVSNIPEVLRRVQKCK